MFENSVDPLMYSPAVRHALGGISRATLHRWIAAGRFPAPLAVGERNAWPESVVAEWIQNHQQRTAAERSARARGSPRTRRKIERDAVIAALGRMGK